MSTEAFIDYAALPVWLLAVLAIVGIAFLWQGGDFLTNGASALGVRLRIDPIIVGLTVVSIATSLPELLTSLLAAMKGSPDVATGNIIGSNIANIALILGVAGLFWPFEAHSSLVRKEMPLLVGVTVLFCILGFFGPLSRIDGIILLATMFGYLGFLVARRKDAGPLADEIAENVPSEETAPSLGKALLYIAIGAVLLAVGSDVFVNDSIEIARKIGVSDLLIGVTLVALGTSLPELTATIVAGIKKQSDLVAGNIVGSNIFNMLLIGGSVSTITNVPFSKNLFMFEIPVMFGVTLLLWRFFHTGGRLSRREGGLLLGIYISFIVLAALLQRG